MHMWKNVTRKMNSNMSKVYIVFKWACHLSKVIAQVEKLINLQLNKFKKSQLCFNFIECNAKFKFTTNAFLPILHSSNLETTSLQMDEHYHSN
jgi:hypothetical protein